MIEREIDITALDGELKTIVLHPKDGGPFPPVVVYMPASGIREELIGLARRLAEGGYFVMLPNLYYRLARVVMSTPTASTTQTTRPCANT